jgi:hypothetical protein
MAGNALAEIVAAAGTGDIAKAESLLVSARSDFSDAERRAAESSIKNAKALKAKVESGADKGKSTLDKPAKSIGAYIQKIDQLNTELVKNNANFALNATAANKVSLGLLELVARNVEFGFSLAEVNKNYRALSENLAARVSPGFDKFAVKLAAQTTKWSRLGISIGDISSHVNLFHTSLGMSIQKTTEMGRVMNHFARTTGQSFSKVWQDFGKQSGRYMDMVDSGRMVRTTLVMQARARAMNMDAGRLGEMLDKFETMDSAQETGAKLNTTLTALGGSFDAVKASSMDYADRQEYIAKSLRSVFPRIQAAGPRAARLYMKSIRTTLGMHAKDLQAMMRAQPGGELSAVTAMARGRPAGAMSAAEESRAAAAVTSGMAKFDAFTKEGWPAAMILALDKTGIISLPVATRKLSQHVGTLASAVNNFATTATMEGGGEVKKMLEAQWPNAMQEMNGLFKENGTLDTAFKRIEAFNEKQRLGAETVATSYADIARMVRDLRLATALS